MNYKSKYGQDKFLHKIQIELDEDEEVCELKKLYE
jgi:hypothetical protein